jgi:hypothetical protein
MMATSKREISAIVEYTNGKLKEGSQAELEARRAIAHILLEGSVPPALRLRLAEMFDPGLRDTVDQEFVLKRTRPRGRPKTVPDWVIATLVERRLRSGDNIQMKEALGHAAEALGVSKRTAEKAHAKEKEQVRALLDAPGVEIITPLD